MANITTSSKLFEDPSIANDVFLEAKDSIVPHVALFGLQIIALVSPRFPGRRFVASGILLAVMIQAHLQPKFTDDVGTAQPFGIQWSFWLATMEKFMLSGDEGPEAHFWREDVGVREAESYPAFSLRKLNWAVMLLFNQRGIGWNHQVKNVPPVTDTKKSVFLFKRFLWMVLYFILADLCIHLNIRFFFTNPVTGAVGDVNSKSIVMEYACPGWRFSTVFVFSAAIYCGLSAQYSLLSIVCVALGLGGPQDWPDQFNPISEATTVRNFWGKYWHQLLRRRLTTWANALVNFLGIRHGTNLSSYTQLWFSFFISGFFHALSHNLFPTPVNVTVPETVYPIFSFFVLQAAAITLEDFVQWLWCKPLGMGEGNSKGRKATGYIWVLVWITYSVRFPALGFLRTRIGSESPLPVSFAEPWMKYVPMPF